MKDGLTATLLRSSVGRVVLVGFIPKTSRCTVDMMLSQILYDKTKDVGKNLDEIIYHADRPEFFVDSQLGDSL